MFKARKASAFLPDPSGVDLAPLDLGVPAQFQFCVDAGASAAAGFFRDMAHFNLHDHIAQALHAFTTSVNVTRNPHGQRDALQSQLCVDAFAAGYLGRIQQQLRLFHGDAFGRAADVINREDRDGYAN